MCDDFYHLLAFGAGGLFHFDSFSLRVQFAVSAFLSGGEFNPVGGFLYALVEARLRDEGGVAD